MELANELRTAKHYIKAIRQELPHEVFRRVPSRLLWLPVHLGLIALSWWAVIALDLAWWGRLPIAVLIGHSFACLSFLGHELLHDSVIRRGPLQSFLGWICFVRLSAKRVELGANTAIYGGS